MRKALLFIIATMLLSLSSFAQSKEAKKEAKALAKQGFKAAAGIDPLEQQLDRAYAMEYELNDKGEAKYISGFGSGISSHYDQARTQAVAAAKEDLAKSLSQKVAASIESMTTNKQISNSEAETLTKSLATSSTAFANSIRKTEVVIEYFRELKNGDKEVSVRLFCDSEAAKERAIESLRKAE